MDIHVELGAWASYIMNNNLGEHSAIFDSSTHIKDLLDDDFDCQYLDVNELQELAVNNSFLVVSQNIRSLGGKFDNFREYIASFRSLKVSVVALQEVWSVGRIYDLPGYHPIEFNTRDKSRTLNSNCGGGVGIYISDSLDYEILQFENQFIEGIYESIWVKLREPFIFVLAEFVR